MGSGCGVLLLWMFWMVAGLYGVGAFTYYVLETPLWLSILVPLLLGAITWLVTGDDI